MQSPEQQLVKLRDQYNQLRLIFFVLGIVGTVSAAAFMFASQSAVGLVLGMVGVASMLTTVSVTNRSERITARLRARDKTQEAIAELAQMSSRMTTLANDVAELIMARQAALQELQSEADEYQQLAQMSQQEAEAVKAVIDRQLTVGQRRATVLSWVQVVVGGLLGVIGTLGLQFFFPVH